MVGWSDNQEAAQGRDDGGWSIASDVFFQRYRSGLSHSEGSWQPLSLISLQLEPAASLANAQRLHPLGNASSAEPPAPRLPPWPAPTSLPPQAEPWLMAAGAYAEAGPWQPATRSTRARMLFQYKPYSQQEPLGIAEEEVAAVVEAVFGRLGPGPSLFQDVPDGLWGSMAGAQLGLAGGASTGEVAAVILIKLIMDMYVRTGSRAAFPLTLMLLQRPLLLGEPAAQARVFDLVYNLSVHGELLVDVAADAMPEDAEVLADAVAELGSADDQPAPVANWKATVTSAFRATLAASLKVAANPRGSADAGRTSRASVEGRSNRASLDGRSHHRSGSTAAAAAPDWPPLAGARPSSRSVRAERFQQWLRLLLFQLLAALSASGTAGEAAWAAALSCLVHLTSHGGNIMRSYIEDLPLAVVGVLLEQARRHLWSEQLHAWLICLAANLMYVHVDSDDYGAHRSMKAGSQTDSWRSGGGSLNSSTTALPSVARGSSSPDAAWWASSHLDPDRLAEFGGVRQVLRCYREAPTAAARRSMFAVLFDYVMGGQKVDGAPALLQRAHGSEAAALGAALLRMDAAEALHPLFLAGLRGSTEPLAAAISMQISALRASNPGRMVSVPGALVAEYLECLEELALKDMQDALNQTREAVTGPEPAATAAAVPAGGSSAAAAWGCLADCLRDPSELGAHAGRGWLLELLLAAAERELGNGGGGTTSVLALLPEVLLSGGCQLQPGRRGLRQHALRELLYRALATTPDSRAADCFIAAVGSLLVHIRLRCGAPVWDAEDAEWTLTAIGGGGGNSSNSMGNGGAADGANGGTPGLRSAASLPRVGSAAAHARSKSAGRQTSRRSSLDGLSDSVGSVEEAAAVRALEFSDSGLSAAHDGRVDWKSVNCPELILSTLCLAVEWLLQAPLEARQAAMLQATRLLLAFTLATPSPGGRQSHGGGGAGRGVGLATPAPSRPGSVQHRLAVQTPAPLQLPASPGSSPAPQGDGAPSPAGAGLPPRPISPSLAALQAAAAAAAGQAQQPPTPSVATLERLKEEGEDGNTISAQDLAALAGLGSKAANSGAGSHAASSQRLEAAAAAAVEASVTLLWIFLNGRGMVPQELLRLLPPLLLRTLFDDLRPDSSALQYDALAAAGAGASAARLVRAADAALGVKATVQSDRPLWDARAAVLLLLMGRCAHDAAALAAVGGAAFFTQLLSEPDTRVRHYASVFVLRQLMLQQPLQYRRALRGVVARAQAANDEKLLCSPYLQLRAMLDLGRIQLEGL